MGAELRISPDSDRHHVKATLCLSGISRLFDHNKSNEHWLVFLQGDKRHGGNSSDGVIARRQIAEVMVHSLTSEAALRETFGLVAVTGPVQENLKPLFAALDADPEGSSDVVHAAANMPLDEEPSALQTTPSEQEW